MSTDGFVALCVFAFASAISPGPSNAMLLASGANFGLVRTLPQVFGIATGFNALLLAVGLGLGSVLDFNPALHLALKTAGALYLIYLAWRIATAQPWQVGDGNGRPLMFLEAAAFQWVNPKAWIVAAAAVAIYARPDAPYSSAMLACVAFGIMSVPALMAWACVGLTARHALSEPRRLRLFNVAMALLLVVSLVPMLR